MNAVQQAPEERMGMDTRRSSAALGRTDVVAVIVILAVLLMFVMLLLQFLQELKVLL